MKNYGLSLILLFVTLISSSQKKNDLDMMRDDFQGIKNAEDIKSIMVFEIQEPNGTDVNILKAYQGAAQCMMANYVFSNLSKLKNFNQGKKIIEASILEKKNVENVYLRLLIQLSVPRMLNYHKNMEEDILYLEDNMSTAAIDLTYKKLMMKNLISVSKKEDQKDALLKINLAKSR